MSNDAKCNRCEGNNYIDYMCEDCGSCNICECCPCWRVDCEICESIIGRKITPNDSIYLLEGLKQAEFHGNYQTWQEYLYELQFAINEEKMRNEKYFEKIGKIIEKRDGIKRY